MKCTAPQYVDFVMSSVQKLVTDEDVFPTKYGTPLPVRPPSAMGREGQAAQGLGVEQGRCLLAGVSPAWVKAPHPRLWDLQARQPPGVSSRLDRAWRGLRAILSCPRAEPGRQEVPMRLLWPRTQSRASVREAPCIPGPGPGLGSMWRGLRALDRGGQ